MEPINLQTLKSSSVQFCDPFALSKGVQNYILLIHQLVHMTQIYSCNEYRQIMPLTHNHHLSQQMKEKEKASKLHFDTTYQNIQVHHWIKVSCLFNALNLELTLTLKFSDCHASLKARPE